MNPKTTKAANPPCRQSTVRRVVRGVARRRTGLSVGAAAPDDFPVRQGRPFAPYPPPSKATPEGFQRASGKPFGAPAGASPVPPAAVRRNAQKATCKGHPKVSKGRAESPLVRPQAHPKTSGCAPQRKKKPPTAATGVQGITRLHPCGFVVTKPAYISMMMGNTMGLRLIFSKM